MYATAVVTDTALLVTERFGDEHRREMPTPGAASARSAFAGGNVDRPVESAKVDIPARHPRGANVGSVAAICLRDAYVDECKPDSDGLVPGVHVLQHGGKGGNRTGCRSGGQHQQGGTGR